MWLHWTFLVLCAHRVFTEDIASIPTPELPHGEAPDPILSLLRRTYQTGQIRGENNAGDPLLLTPYIEKKQYDEARKAAQVDSTYFVPGVDSYAGYFTVNKEYNANLFFWYFPIADKPVDESPWIIWLQGGPGAPSLFGLFTEIGPFVVTDNNTVEEIKYSWGKNHSLLFIDNPVGTGFSFTDDDRGYATNQTTIGENLYSALQQFLTIFSELRIAPLTIAGESYAGKHIPSLAIQILWHKNEDEPINFHGLAIGDAYLDPISLLRYSYFAREIGLVDDKVADDMKNLEIVTVQCLQNGDMMQAFKYNRQLLELLENASRVNIYNFMYDSSTSIQDGPYVNYIQRDEVRRALHVGSTNYTAIGMVYKKLIPDFMTSAKMWLEELLENYQVMLYNGQLDVIVAYHLSVNTHKSLNFSGASEYKNATRMPWYHDNKLAGYYKKGGNLTEVMVRGAGHMVPTDQPAAALGLISAFIRGIPLEEDTGVLIDTKQQSLRKWTTPGY